MKRFDDSVRKTREWLTEIAIDLNVTEERAYLALRATLHALRDRLPPVEAAHLAASMPLIVRGIYYEHWDPTNKPIKMHKDDFLEQIATELTPDMDPLLCAESVFRLLDKKLSVREHIANLLPHDLRSFLPDERTPAEDYI